MNVKSRLRRLETDVEWLETDGKIRHLEIMFKIVEMKQEMADRLAEDKETAARFARAGLLRTLDLPPPSWGAKPAPPAPTPRPIPVASPRSEPVPEPSPEPAPEPAPRPQPTLRDAAPRAAPQGEVVPEDPPEPERVQPFTYDPPPEMQIRPVTWRRRGPQDYEDDGEDMYGRCIVDYDPLAEEDADYDEG